MTLKIGILQTDSVLDQFQSEFGNYPEMFTDMLLKASDGSAEIINYDVEHFQYPVEIDECDDRSLILLTIFLDKNTFCEAINNVKEIVNENKT